MGLKEKIKRIQGYPLHFCYGELLEEMGFYDLDDGIFLLGKIGSEVELWWGAWDLEGLMTGLNHVRKEHNTSFIFRFPGKLQEVLEASQNIALRGYRLENIHVGYRRDFEDLPGEDSEKEIRPFQAEDKENLIELDREIFPAMNIEPAELLSWLDSGEAIILVAPGEDSIRGFVVLEIYGGSKQYCFVRSLAVAPQERGKGLGKKLFLAGLNQAKKREAKKCMLWVDYDNKPARNMYEKLGFQLDEKETEAVFRV